jgi:phosphate uptake regulator
MENYIYSKQISIFGVKVKRKIVKHGPSSYIVSLPLNWVKKHNLNKGDEINVDEVDNNVLISTSYKEKFEKVDFNIKDIKDITTQIINAMYKRGIDEIRIHYDKQDEFKLIMKAVSDQSVGFEIVETTSNSCTIRSITKLSNEFDAVLRRLFLVTLSLGEEGLKAIKNKDYNSLENIMFLEKSNNKLSTFCSRYLNKYSAENYDRVGAIYFMIEILEKIADEYKYLFENQRCFALQKQELNQNLLDCYTRINQMLRLFYESFYKYDYSKIRKISKERNVLLSYLWKEIDSLKSSADICLHHHAIALVEKIFSLVDPYLVLADKR